MTVDLIIPALPDGGAHVFTSSLFVGETYRSNADLLAAGIAQGGDGPALTIEAGATLAFQTNKDFVIINRGSRVLANGRADAPITFTSVTDINGTVGPEEVQQWGGIVINGFGERLFVAGRNGAPDGFEQPFHSLDFTYFWYPTDAVTFKAKAQNLLGESIEIRRKDVTTFREDPGTTVQVSFVWSVQ